MDLRLVGEKVIGNAVRSLEKQGVLFSRQELNAVGSGRRKWYRVNYHHPILIGTVLPEDDGSPNEDIHGPSRDAHAPNTEDVNPSRDAHMSHMGHSPYTAETTTETRTEKASVSARTKDNTPPTEPTGKPAPGGDPPKEGPPKPDRDTPSEPPADRHPFQNGRRDGQVHALVNAFHRAKGMNPDSVAARTRKMDFSVFKGLSADVTSDDVMDCVRYMESDQWWREPGRLTSRKVMETLPEWIAKCRPEAVVPKEARSTASTRGPGRFEQLGE